MVEPEIAAAPTPALREPPGPAVPGRRMVLALALPLALYALVAGLAAVRKVEHTNPDELCYIQFARDLVAGRPADSVSAYWSPLISWSIAPFLAMGLDGLAAARLALALWGGLFLAAAFLLTRRLAALPVGWSLPAGLILAVQAGYWASRVVTPDLVLAASLLFYFYLALRPDLHRSPRGALACGLVGGVSFLAKAYALPFFLVHFPLTLALRQWVERRRAAGAGETPPAWRGLAGPLAAGLLGWALLAGPWIGALSARQGRFTWSTAGAYNHALVGPPARRNHPMCCGLWLPEPGRFCIWETPEKLPLKDWSPLASAENFRYQLRVIAANLPETLHGFDRLALTLALLAATPFLAWAFRRAPPELFRLLWGSGTILLFCAGYLPILVERRYLAPVVWALGLVLCGHFAALGLARITGRGLRLALTAAVAAVLLAAFAAYPARLTIAALRKGGVESYRAVGERIAAASLPGPIASNHWGLGLYAAWHASQPYLGAPQAAEAQEREAELSRGGARVFILWRPPGNPPPFPEGSPWKLRLTVPTPDRNGGGCAEVYALRETPDE